jgi:hypothetical protein
LFVANHSKPLNTITLSDADEETALAFVQQKLKEAKSDLELTSGATASIGRLGGRASDLDNVSVADLVTVWRASQSAPPQLIYKVRNGSSIEDAVEDIIARGVGELRKNAFGDDAEDVKELPWTRAQAWGLMKRLAKEGEVGRFLWDFLKDCIWLEILEIPYHDTLMSFPFKGEETALRNMEHAELIAISTHNGRPSTIRPGKPVYKWIFERVVGGSFMVPPLFCREARGVDWWEVHWWLDPVFGASQDIEFNKQLIAASESTIKGCEEELLRLTEIGEYTKSSVFGADRAVSMRTRYLLKAMGEASAKIESLERANVKLKKLLANH